MSDEDIYAVEVLQQCNIRPGTVTKKWINIMYSITKTTRIVTSGQIDEIWRFVYEFRNRIKDKELIEKAKRRI